MQLYNHYLPSLAFDLNVIIVHENTLAFVLVYSMWTIYNGNILLYMNYKQKLPKQRIYYLPSLHFYIQCTACNYMKIHLHSFLYIQCELFIMEIFCCTWITNKNFQNKEFTICLHLHSLAFTCIRFMQHFIYSLHRYATITYKSRLIQKTI